MAGSLPEREKDRERDVLFDLVPDDDKALLESDLLQLVNFGQLTEHVKVPGSNGRVYIINMSLLWDEDYASILKATSKYAGDPVLRSRLIRRLRLHKAINAIDDREYGNQVDVVAKRELWTLICRMSAFQVDYLDGEYLRLEQERNEQVTPAIKALIDKIDKEAPEGTKLKKEPPPEVPPEAAPGGTEVDKEKEADAEIVKPSLNEPVEGANTSSDADHEKVVAERMAQVQGISEPKEDKIKPPSSPKQVR